jgi:chaperonin GroES
MQFRIRPDHYLIEPAEAEKVTKSGFYIPDEAQKKPEYGKVIQVGGVTGGNTPFAEVGDYIYYKPYTGYPITLEEVNYLIVAEEDVIGNKG